MPEAPNIKSREIPEAPIGVGPSPFAYAELDVTSNFSFLRGASHPDELVFRAAELGYRAIGIADRNSLAGVVRAHDAVRQVKEQGGIAPQLLIGARLCFEDAPDVLAYPTDRAAYGRLCRLLTLGKRRAEKGKCLLYLEDFLQVCGGMVGVVVEGENEAQRHGGTEARRENKRLASSSPSCLSALVPSCLIRLREAMGRRVSLGACALYGGDDAGRLRRVFEMSRRLDIPLVATNHVHYHDPSRRRLQDVLVCIRNLCTIDQAGYRLFPNDQRYMKSPEQMHRLFVDYPQALRRGIQIAEECHFSLDELRYEYPVELVPEGMKPIEYLRELAYAGAWERYREEGSGFRVQGSGELPLKARELLEHELLLIEQLGFEAYFLTVHDLVRFARSRGILCQGRGSAANSAVCYCLGVTSVDPMKIDILFERFISAARNEPPDIDIDFEHERREEVIQYIYEKYGRERSGMTGVVITYRGRSAVRDVGKALGLSLDRVDQMAKKLDWWHRGTISEEMLAACGLDPQDATIRRVVELTGQILGFPRHLSQHVGGMVMTRGPLCEMVPIENASMEGRTVIEWDKDDIDALGILKVDALALGMLTAISKALKFINRHEGTEARRHEGKDKDSITQGEIHVGDSDISRFNRVATWNGTGSNDLPIDRANASLRTIWADESDETSSGVDSIEHRGRVCAAEPARLLEISPNIARIAGRTLNPVRVGNGSAHDPEGTDGLGSARGGGPGPAGTDQESRSEIGIDEESSSFPSCLRAFVPSCLIQLHTIPWEDPAVYDMICNADTIGVFQIESRAQMSMLPRLRPRCFYDLVIEVAIVRPGPIQGNMVHPYLRRRNGEEQVTYPSEALRNVLEKTLGVPLFQEQAMKVAMVGAGFSAGEADQLRRAMAAWRKSGAIEKFYPKIINGMTANGYTREFAEQCFNQIKGFGEYGFPESHAASFARLVYASAWIKHYYPAAFAAALLNSQPMGFYAPAQLVRDATEHGVKVRGVDVNFSDWDCSLEKRFTTESTKDTKKEETNSHRCTPMDTDKHQTEIIGANRWQSVAHSPPICVNPCPSVANSSSPDSSVSSVVKSPPAMRMGFRLVKGLREEFGKRIEAARAQVGRFVSVSHFHRVTGIPAHAVGRLAEADAFESLGLSRRQAVWEAMELVDEEAGLFEEEGSGFRVQGSVTGEAVALPTMSLGEEVMTDYRTTTLSLKKHPIALIRDHLRSLHILTSREITDSPNGRWVKVAGLVLIRQRPGTASGIVFETLEDETGIVNLIIRPDVFDRFRPAARHAGLLQADGYVERQGQVVHIMAKRLFDLSHLLNGYQITSRDFH